MLCTTPVTLKNPKYGILPDTLKYMQVSCKKCTNCLNKRSRSWIFRLQWEEKRSITAAFLTYTYSNSTVPLTDSGLLTLKQKHHTDYIKRLRKEIAKKSPHKLKYYTVGEYGGQTERPHYHSIIFNIPLEYLKHQEAIEALWTHGNVQIDKCTSASISYVCNYINKQKHDRPETDRKPEFSVMSKHLGENFLTPSRIKHMKTNLEPFIKIDKGIKLALPDYYKRKALTDVERSRMALKSTNHLSQNPQFSSGKQEVDTVYTQSLQRRKKSKTRNKI